MSDSANPVPAWKKTLLVLAVASVGFGLYLRTLGDEPQDTARGDGPAAVVEGAPKAAVKRLTDREAPPPQVPVVRATEPQGGTGPQPWSTFFTSAGASFLAAFVVGALARRFVKTVALFFAAIGLLFVGLAYLGIVDLSRDDVQARSTEAVEEIATSSEKLVRFLTGLLPSTAAAAVGLAVGFKRN